MKLKDISRTATFAWDQSSSASPLLATGAAAGALDESFSNESQLEIWAPDFGESQGLYLGGEESKAHGSITVNSRFNRLAWSTPTSTASRGVLAAGMETGEINVFDPEKIINGATADEARLFTNNKHTGPVRGLDFNPIQRNLMLSGAVNAELYIFDLNNPTNPIPPGSLSTKLGEITSVQWNSTVSRIFAASSSSGFTSVWDLRTQKEIASLQYGGGAAKGMGTVGGVAGLQMGKRRGMSDVCWHPEQATRLITASEDDESPIIMLWDLRNTRAPERILSGHTKGVLSVSWCKQDSDLLLSCGKDNRTLCWNPQTGDIVGELPSSSDWSFQTAWCPRNPDLLATASFDGHIGIHSLQTTHVPEQSAPQFGAAATADDIFAGLGQQEPSDQNANILSLNQPPKWLRRPVSATFGFGGLLASTSNLPAANGKHQSGVVHLRNVVTEQNVIERAQSLDGNAEDKEKLESFCNANTRDSAWKTLQTLFKANSRDELVQLLGFSKEDVAKQVQEAIEKFPSLADATEPIADGASTPKAESVRAESVKAESVSTEEAKDDASQSSLFPEDAGADFFSSMASGSLKNHLLENIIPHKSEAAASSVAVTVGGSRASSVRSEVVKDNIFHIYPSGENDVDRLVTRALVLGDFASAVNLCLASERFADALLLAVRGGPELLQSTQKAYFAKRTTSVPFLRVFQSIVTEDLADIVQNADLGEWKVIFIVLCTFAKDGDFNNLADQLGQRLQYRWQLLNASESPENKLAAKETRENATLCFLAARKLEKVVGIWTEELREEEQSSSAARYTAHAQALQSFIEKVSVFTAATGYVDQDLLTPTESAAAAEAGARTYKLASLYDRYYEYADLLATQGLVDIAAKYVQKTPVDYKGTEGAASDFDKARERLLKAASVQDTPQPKARPAVPSAYAPAPAFTPSAPSTSAYAAPTSYQPPPPAPQPQPQPQSQSYGYGSSYAPTQPYQNSAYTPSGYGADPQPQGYGVNSYAAPQPLAPPPRASQTTSGSTSTPPPIPAAQRRDMPGWNDAPNFAPPKRPTSAARETPKPAPIMSPFPNAEPSGPGFAPNIVGSTPPPPRASQPGVLPPPPKGGPRPPSAQAIVRNVAAPSQARPLPQSGPSYGPPPTQLAPPQPAGPPPGPPRGPPRGGPPPGVLAGPPPRALSPLGPQGRTTPLTATLQGGPRPPSRNQSAVAPVQSPPVATPPPPAAPVKPTHPVGDRSHISESSKPIYHALSVELQRVKQSDLPANIKRIVDDTERRLNILFDQLNNDSIPKPILGQLGDISRAIAAKDSNGALALHVQLLTNATGEMTAWVTGVKQLIRLGV